LIDLDSNILLMQGNRNGEHPKAGRPPDVLRC
jgi:hypothetical protein